MGLRENILSQPVSDLSIRELVSVPPTETVRETVALMRGKNMGAAIVIDDAGYPIGMFNEKLLIHLFEAGTDAMGDPVEKHMTRSVACVGTQETIATLIATIHSRGLRWICICDEAGKAIGISGVRGVMEYVTEHHPRSVLVQPLQSKLSVDEREGA